MSRPFDMTLFLLGVLTGSKSTQQRHLRQAQVIQAAIKRRWHRDNPWTWQFKHFRWFFNQYLKGHSEASRYYYRLTALLIWKRIKGPATFKHQPYTSLFLKISKTSPTATNYLSEAER
ncbi:hypothetical protein [Pseudomonas eucalypticola]|uniref:hypothetical protein n=1 Tax=Pseudomonas eucalypticola TaxID=2599595 RepID=UPI001FD82C34|nr:hypothetical protein [Pseudomonas eucalypticola]